VISDKDIWRSALAMVLRAHDEHRFGDAEQLAAALPPAPRCPL